MEKKDKLSILVISDTHESIENLNKLYEGTKDISESKLSWEAWSRRFREIMSKY